MTILQSQSQLLLIRQGYTLFSHIVMIHIAGRVLVWNFSEETAPQTQGEWSNPPVQLLQSRLTHTDKKSIKRFAVLVSKCVSAQRMHFPPSIRSSSHKPFKGQSAKDCRDANISISFGEVDLRERQLHCLSGSLCIWSSFFLWKVHNLTGMDCSCSRRKVVSYSLMLRAHDFPCMITILLSSGLTRRSHSCYLMTGSCLPPQLLCMKCHAGSRARTRYSSCLHTMCLSQQERNYKSLHNKAKEKTAAKQWLLLWAPFQSMVGKTICRLWKKVPSLLIIIL